MRKLDPEKHAARRQMIVEAAKGCFTRKGFHQTSTAEICAEAGMSPGNLFHYFSSKKAIIAAIVEQERRDTARYFEEIGATGDRFDVLRSFMDIILTLAADPGFAGLALEISAEATRDRDVAVLVRRNDRELRAHLEKLLTEAVQRGDVDSGLEPATAATWIAAIVDGIFGRVAADPSFRPLAERKTVHLLLDRMMRPDRHRDGKRSKRLLQ